MNHKILKLSILIGVLLLMALVIGGRPTPALADVAVGDFIDSNNVQKIQGLVPDVIYDYVKKGWITMKIGKLNYEPSSFHFNTEGEKRNIGKYDVLPDNEMVEKATGVKTPMDFVGTPFPASTLDPKDPKMGAKFFYNAYVAPIYYGCSFQTAALTFIGSKGFERYISGPQKVVSTIGSEANIAYQKYGSEFGGKDMSQLFIMRVTDPYELNGLASMTYSYLGNTPDKVFAYVPALRRARVLTAAARSDSMFGTDYSLDDAGCGWWGKPVNFDFKYLRTQEALVQYADADPVKFFPNPDGSIDVQKEFTKAKFGYTTAGWKGKPWAITNSIWVKRKAYVFEVNAKDPYYNYGRMEVWGDAKTSRPFVKIINDRAGKRWKVMIMNSHAGYGINNYPWGLQLCARGDVIYDEQRDHATGIEEYRPGERKNFNAKVNISDFTLTGLSKISK